MEIIKVVLVLALVLSNVLCQGMDADTCRECADENKWPNSEAIQDILVRMARKPGPRQYLGLMGKKDFGKTQTARKRHKFQAFVGLMGKRSSEFEGSQ
ncbi:protachykinin [Parambassis ranga]|uniref:Protachykinin n=1 Tax=Parambassis ranga TaxID=210632 RepID=A0A6P7JTX3_9TELE|nr:protachykinin-like [Parambassis ranga]